MGTLIGNQNKIETVKRALLPTMAEFVTVVAVLQPMNIVGVLENVCGGPDFLCMHIRMRFTNLLPVKPHTH